MRLARPLLVLLTAFAPSALLAQGATAVKQMAHARVKLAEQIAVDPEIRKAVAAKNAEAESQQVIEARDREWTQNPAAPRRKALTGSRCAARLRELIAADPLVVESILMDERGANVCVSRETSDYWQGDEDKWKKPFLEGRAAFVDEPTNELDVDTLRALEEALISFAGCAVVISHDRWLLDRIATHILAFEGDSQVVWFEGNYQDYEADRKRRLGVDADQPHRIKYRKLTR